MSELGDEATGLAVRETAVSSIAASHTVSNTSLASCAAPTVTVTIVGEQTDGTEASAALYTAGQRMRATYAVTGGVRTAVQWTIDEAIAMYQADAEIGLITELSADELGADEVLFYWPSAGIFFVTCDVTVRTASSTVPVRARVECLVDWPIVDSFIGTPSAAHGAVTPDSYLAIGDPTIVFTAVIQENHVLPGFLNGIQVVRAYSLRIRYGEDEETYTHADISVIDTECPYGERTELDHGAHDGWSAADTPNFLLEEECQEIEQTVAFDMYLVFSPLAPHAIWVALSKVSWSYTVRATRGQDGWVASGTAQVTGRVDCYGGRLPEWTKNSREFPDLEPVADGDEGDSGGDNAD